MAAGMRAAWKVEAGEAGEVGKQCLKQHCSGCKPAHSEFVEAKKRDIAARGGGCDERAGGSFSFRKGLARLSKPLRWPGYEDTGGGRR